MKLTKLHLFLILLLVLLFSSMGIGVLESFGVIEGNANIGDSTTSINSDSSSSTSSENTSLDNEMKYDPNDILTKTSMPDVRINYKNLSNEKKKLGFGSPDGISKDEIPPGDEHLYVLKSEIVPPVCPKCPEQKCSGGAKKECPPCPRPERCPEPAFTCKKVPNYSAASVDNVLPSPMFMSGGGSGGSGGSAGFGGGAGSNGPMPMLNSFAKFS